MERFAEHRCEAPHAPVPAGTIALAIGGLGLLGKLVADSLEETPPGPEIAVRAAGSTRLQVFFAATFRLNIPAFIGHSLYLFDTNLRSGAASTSGAGSSSGAASSSKCSSIRAEKCAVSWASEIRRDTLAISLASTSQGWSPLQEGVAPEHDGLKVPVPRLVRLLPI
jgi:hypothetical protein